MKQSLTIIPMKRGHIKACDDIVAASEPWKTLREKVDFKQAITRGQAFACIRREGGTIEVVGFILFTAEPVFARGGYLRAIGVAPSLRGQGIGGKLMAFAEKAISRRSDYCYLCVSSFNGEARRLYERRGYAAVGELKDYIIAGASETIMQKRLPRP